MKDIGAIKGDTETKNKLVSGSVLLTFNIVLYYIAEPNLQSSNAIFHKADARNLLEYIFGF